MRAPAGGWAPVVVACGLLALGFLALAVTALECSRRGGHLVRTPLWYTCITQAGDPCDPAATAAR